MRRHAALQFGQQLRVEDDLQDLVAARAPGRLDVEHFVVVVAESALAVDLAQQVGQAEPVLAAQHRLVQQRRTVAQQLQRRRGARVEVALGVARSDRVEAGDVDVLEVAAAFGGELLPRVRRPPLRPRQVQVERGQMRALHVGVDVGAGDPPHR